MGLWSGMGLSKRTGSERGCPGLKERWDWNVDWICVMQTVGIVPCKCADGKLAG